MAKKKENTKTKINPILIMNKSIFYLVYVKYLD